MAYYFSSENTLQKTAVLFWGIFLVGEEGALERINGFSIHFNGERWLDRNMFSVSDIDLLYSMSWIQYIFIDIALSQ